jgi:hypothetical protein
MGDNVQATPRLQYVTDSRIQHERNPREDGMKRQAALVPMTPALKATILRNARILRTALNENYSGLSFLRMSVALLMISVFWMVVQLHAYVVWLRGREKALLLIAVIGSCIAIYVNDQIRMNSQEEKRVIENAYWILTLFLVTVLVIYLTTSEPPPISLLFPDLFIEVPGARWLKTEGLAIIFLILAPFGGALVGIRIQKIFRNLTIFIPIFCTLCLLSRFMSFVYYTCGADFPHTLLTCHGIGIADIGGTTLNAIHAVQNGINPYTIDIQGNYNPDSAYRGYRYWPMMIAIYMPMASFFTTGQGAMRLTNFALDVITAALIVLLVRRRSGWLCGVLAGSLYLMLPMLPERLYAAGDTDLAPTVLLLAALALYQTRPGLAGVMVGLSVSAKFLPGLLMLVCCLPEFRRSRYVGGFVLGLIPTIAFCLLAPSDFIDNTVRVLAATPVDGSSWLYGAPFYLIRVVQFAFILLMAAISFMIISRSPDSFERCTLYVICVVATLLVSHVHNNYMLWWIPFFCILLSSPLSKILSLPGSLGSAPASGARPQ